MPHEAEAAARPQESLGPFQFVMLVLSVYVLIAIFVESVVTLSPETSLILKRVDDAICVIFLIDFSARLARAQNRWRFMRWGWIDLISSIPMLDALRWGRLIRIVRILRLLRAIRSTKHLVHFFFRNRAQGTFATVALISVTLTIFSAIAILQFETDPNSNIKSPMDSLWWAYVTITTVGYGDKYPVTPEGRLLAALLMTAGVGLFGTFTGFIASFFVEPDQKKETAELDEVLAELKAMREELSALRAAVGR